MIYENQTYDEERALYNIKDSNVITCKFEGPADGESPLKEVRNVDINNSTFSLRYPLWHARKFTLIDSAMDDQTRAPIWYAEDGKIEDCQIAGIKCLRECKTIEVNGCSIDSPEFGWKCADISLLNTDIESEYLFLDSKNLFINQMHMSGKYSFQYVENVKISDSELDTKDAFWHSKDVTVENSTLRGEYLGWFSENLTLINCKIIGTQPLCYCKKLKLVDCTMEDTDLAFEYSDVDATVNGAIDSIKNPRSGIIVADGVGDIILDHAIMESSAKIHIRG
jgi:hypothetical protein